MRVCACRADRADFLLVRQQAAARILRILAAQDRVQRGEGADAVILPVCSDHAAVKTKVSCRTCRHNLQLCGEEILFLHPILVFQDIENLLLYQIFCFFLSAVCIFLLSAFGKRLRSDQDIQILALDGLRKCLPHLVL